MQGHEEVTEYECLICDAVIPYRVADPKLTLSESHLFIERRNIEGNSMGNGVLSWEQLLPLIWVSK